MFNRTMAAMWSRQRNRGAAAVESRHRRGAQRPAARFAPHFMRALGLLFASVRTGNLPGNAS